MRRVYVDAFAIPFERPQPTFPEQLADVCEHLSPWDQCALMHLFVGRAEARGCTRRPCAAELCDDCPLRRRSDG